MQQHVSNTKRFYAKHIHAEIISKNNLTTIRTDISNE